MLESVVWITLHGLTSAFVQVQVSESPVLCKVSCHKLHRPAALPEPLLCPLPCKSLPSV